MGSMNKQIIELIYEYGAAMQGHLAGSAPLISARHYLYGNGLAYQYHTSNLEPLEPVYHSLNYLAEWLVYSNVLQNVKYTLISVSRP